MSGSIELKLRDKDVQKQPRKMHLPPSLPVFVPEVITPEDTTTEAWVLRTSRVEHLINVPLNVARKVIIVDALDYHITTKEKLALIAYGLWTVSGNFDDIQQHLGINSYARINPLLDLVIDNAQSSRSNIKLGDCIKEVSEIEDVLRIIEPLAKDSKRRERLKAVVEVVLRLQGDGLTNEQILKRKQEIKERVRLQLRREARSKTTE